MTAENQRTRIYLGAVELAVHEALAEQPEDDEGCARVLEAGMDRVESLVRDYRSGGGAA